MSEELIKLIKKNINWRTEEDESPFSFDDDEFVIVGDWEAALTVQCEPEDAIWGRDLSDNYYIGVEAGIRAALVHFLGKEKAA